MGLFDFIKQRFGGGPAGAHALLREWTDEGVLVRFAKPLTEPTVDALLAATDQASAEETFLAAYLSQLLVAERCVLTSAGVTLSWPLVYELLDSPEHAGALQALELPPMRDLKPVLDSVDTLVDQTFEVRVDGWVADGMEAGVSSVRGAVAVVDGHEALLLPAAWQTHDAARKFSTRPAAKRSQHENELGWGAIRAHADAAGALYRGPYLETTYVLTPQTLRMPLRREDTPFGRVLNRPGIPGDSKL